MRKKVEKYLDKYAIDILDKDLHSLNLKRILKEYKVKNLKEMKFVVYFKQEYLCSGIGNYMKCEILYDCKLSPYRSINDINDNEIKDLYGSILKITDINIKADGRALDEFHVFTKKEDRKGNNVIKEKTPDGRMTYWVKEIQK